MKKRAWKPLLMACGLFAACLGPVSSVVGQATTTPPRPTTETQNSAATKTATAAAERIPVTNVFQLRQQAGKSVTVLGKVNDTNTSRSGRHFLRFYGSELTVTCAEPIARKFPGGGPAKLYINKYVEVTGKVELFKNKLQIQLTDPELIKIVTAPASSSSPKLPKATLKKVAETIWISPAGLRYTGRDPQGLTRREHVLRHSKDQPRRVGPHGVFDGDEEEAFGIIDAAWKQAKVEKYQPKVEGRQSTFTVSMGYRIGFLGGSLGKAKGNPPLKKVFIVFETGTQNIITAFPR